MTIDELKAYGANITEGLQRCMNNESFYFRLVKMIPGDPNFQKLNDAMEDGDLDAAFAAAHALKGTLGNLALTPIYQPVTELTEILRNADGQADPGNLPERIMESFAALKALAE